MPDLAVGTMAKSHEAQGVRGKCVDMLLLKRGCILALIFFPISPTWAASDVLPVALMSSGNATEAPVANLAFAPGPYATRAPDFVGEITVAQTPMQDKPAIAHPMQNRRDARLFPPPPLPRRNSRLLYDGGTIGARAAR